MGARERSGIGLRGGDTRVMSRVARLYYVDGLGQQEIARRLGTSRATVSRILQGARDRGIVQIHIVSPPEYDVDLAAELERRFGLQDVVVVRADHSGEGQLKESLAQAAADLVRRVVRPGDLMGVSWGTTLGHVARFLRPSRPTNVTVVPLVGGVGQVDLELHSNSIADGIARALGGRSQLLHAPVILSSPATRDLIMQEPEVSNVLRLARSVSIALVGVGAPIESSTMIRTGYFSPQDLAELRRRGVVGDICSRFYDICGNPCETPFEERVCGISLQELAGIDYVIGVAGGTEKARAILGALRGGFLDVLVTDEETAMSLLREEDAADSQRGLGRG